MNLVCHQFRAHFLHLHSKKNFSFGLVLPILVFSLYHKSRASHKDMKVNNKIIIKICFVYAEKAMIASLREKFIFVECMQFKIP